jgi:coenzyme Q-binding protein COQ10
MPKIINSISTPFKQEDLFKLVADVELYPQFLPWCEAARIKEKKENVLIVELVIKYKIFCGSYTSKVSLTPNSEIKTELVEGPFKYLESKWGFIPEENGTRIEFALEFELTSKFLENIISNEIENYYKKMLEAFLRRAEQLFKV